jgi:multiple sugar transport system permease protein/raffinose/stachyose/melibiose transport system permease protein
MSAQLQIGLGQIRRLPLVLFVILYTAVTGGPLLWVATMSLRTTSEIFKNPYGFPSPAHWEKFADAWTKSNYSTYFWNSTIVVVIAVVLVTVIGAMAAHCLAASRFLAIDSSVS